VNRHLLTIRVHLVCTKPKARYTLSVSTGRVYGPCSRAVFTGRVRGPCLRAVFTGRVHEPCSRLAVNTSRHFGHPCSRSLNTAVGHG